MYCICSYSKFNCKISYQIDTKYLLDNFINDFGIYYNFIFSQPIPYSVEINLHNSNKEIDFKNEFLDGEYKLIHSSHSKNKKYLLDGKIHTQKDANKYAMFIEIGDKRIYNIKESNSLIVINGYRIDIYGENIYDDFIYIFETLLNTYFESIGGIALHAASCTLNGSGIIICGKSGAGKTSLLFDLINKKKALFHSNDRVIVYEENSLLACGIPIPVNVPLKAMKTFSRWSENEIVKYAENDSKIRFKVNEIPLLFDNIEKEDTVLKTVFIPNYNSSQPNIKQISAITAMEYLELLTPIDECHPNWLNIFKNYNDVNSYRSILLKWLDQINIYIVSGNSLIDAVKDKV